MLSGRYCLMDRMSANRANSADLLRRRLICDVLSSAPLRVSQEFETNAPPGHRSPLLGDMTTYNTLLRILKGGDNRNS
jgi:hypothetical protein